MFPTKKEYDLVYNIITLDLILNLNDEKSAAPLYYWVGLKVSTSSSGFNRSHNHWFVSNSSRRVASSLFLTDSVLVEFEQQEHYSLQPLV